MLNIKLTVAGVAIFIFMLILFIGFYIDRVSMAKYEQAILIFAEACNIKTVKKLLVNRENLTLKYLILTESGDRTLEARSCLTLVEFPYHNEDLNTLNGKLIWGVVIENLTKKLTPSVIGIKTSRIIFVSPKLTSLEILGLVKGDKSIK